MASFFDAFRKVAEAPTNPHAAPQSTKTFDVADLYSGPIELGETENASCAIG